MINSVCDTLNIYSDNGKTTTGAEVHVQPTPNGFHIDISAPSVGVTKIVLRWNHLLPTGLRILSDHWERGYGDLEWRGFVPERVLPWYILLFDPSNSTTQGLGVSTGGGSFASWRVDQNGVTLVLDVCNGTHGVQLGSRTLRAATVQTLVSKKTETPFTFARRFCKLLCARPRLAPFPVYGGNDWYYTDGNNSDAIIRQGTALIRELSPNRDNAPFMVIDAGWFPVRHCGGGGPYDKGNEWFPDMPGLATAIKAQGVRPGIWMRPLLTAAAPASWRMPAAHPIWKREKQVNLDPSVPEVLQLICEDITRLREWGYTLIKHDFSTFDITGRWGFEMLDGSISTGDWSFADKSQTTAEIIKNLYQTIRDAAEDVILIGCNTIGHLGAGLFELQRTGDDTSGHEWERTRKMGVNTLAFRMAQHDTFFASDADCVALTKRVAWEPTKQWLELVAASATPLFVSADPAVVGPEQRAALMKAFSQAATAQPPAEPLDWLETTCPQHWRLGNDTRKFHWGMAAVNK